MEGLLAQSAFDPNTTVSLDANSNNNFPFYTITYNDEDMDLVSRNTNIGSSWTDVYNYSGAGYLLGFNLRLENATENWYIRIVIDGHEVCGSNGRHTEDLYNSDFYNYGINNDYGMNTFNGWAVADGKNIRWRGAYQIATRFNTSVVIKLRRTGGSKKFKAGHIVILKEQ